MPSEYAQYPHLIEAPHSAWFVHYQDGEGAERITYSNGLAGPIESQTINSEISLPLKLTTHRRPNQDPPPRPHEGRYETFIQLAKYAGQHTTFPTRTNARTERTPDGEVYQSEGLLFTEDLPPTAGSLLLKVVPGYDTHATDGLWVLMDALEDETMLENTVCEITVSATIVAWVSDYETRSEVTRDLEYAGL